MNMNLWPGRGGWALQMQGDCEYHIATVAGGHLAGYVTRNDADEWVAGVYDKNGISAVVGSGYPSSHKAKIAVDDARNPAERSFDPPEYDDPEGVDKLVQESSDSLFAPETLEDVSSRLAFIDSSGCNCAEGPHENALHDLAYDDVPVLLRVIERLEAELERAYLPFFLDVT